jgi:hypothetical protein
LPIAGASIMYIYKQAPLNVMIDINRNLLNLHQQDNEDKQLANRNDVKQYLVSAKWFAKLYDECIDIVSNV